MKTFEEINEKELKKVCRSLNEADLLDKKLVYGKTKKGAEVYTEFMMAVEGLDEELQRKLPDDVVAFYNDSVSDEISMEPMSEEELTIEDEEVASEEEDELNGLKPLDFESDEAFEPEESYEEEEPIRPTGLDPIDVDEIVVETEVPESRVEAVLISEPAIEPDKPIKKYVKLSKIPMYPNAGDGKLNIKFPTIEVDEFFDLPKQGDKAELKAFRKRILAFAIEKGATAGQRCAISKELNLAGYYMR